MEHCISTTTAKACVGCPFNKQKLCDKDQWALESYALDLINRQRAEIERLKSAKDEMNTEEKMDRLIEILLPLAENARDSADDTVSAEKMERVYNELLKLKEGEKTEPWCGF